MSLNEYTAHEDDIYRGEDDHHQVLPSASSSSSSSSSTSSIIPAGRIGAIAAKLELAISRWAKNVRRTSSSSSTTSSTSSLSSLNRSQLSRKRRRSRAASISSEREIAFRISRLMALRESRQILRGFTLHLPPSVIPALVHQVQSNSAPGSVSNSNPHITSTTSLSILLTQLEAAIRFSGKQRRQRHHHKHRGSKFLEGSSRSPSHFRLFPPDDSVSGSMPATMKGKKYKQQESRVKPARIPEEHQTKPLAWFLDVSSPSWADLQAIGKLLHIHPLTLEDILQQDPREKVEDFPNLGYYFISFRTIENRGRFQGEASLQDSSASIQGLDEGFIGETNVYLTIFTDGICCFHYTDVSEHTDRIRTMMLRSEKNATMTSEWLAHTVLDSIVDSFFPILDEIDQEVTAIDHIVFRDTTIPQLHVGSNIKIPLSASVQPTDAEKTEIMTFEKRIQTPSYRTRFVSPRVSISLQVRRARRHLSRMWRGFWKKSDNPNATQLTLRRMARVKKLIAVLGRLLSSKSDVMTGIKKRLIKAIESSHERTPGRQAPEEVEIAMYMADIQDHIFALQLSLAHHERMLSHTHHAYMSNLRTELENTKSGIDMKVLYLSTVTLTVVLTHSLTGVFSLNVNIPRNTPEPGGKYIAFSLVLAAGAVITVAMFALVHHWWKKAARRRTTLL